MYIKKFNKKIEQVDSTVIVRCEGYVTIVRCGDAPFWYFEDGLNSRSSRAIQESKEVFVKLEVEYELSDVDADLNIRLLNEPDFGQVAADLCGDVLFDDADFKAEISDFLNENHPLLVGVANH